MATTTIKFEDIIPAIYALKAALAIGIEFHYNKEGDSVKFKLPKGKPQDKVRIAMGQVRPHKELITCLLTDPTVWREAFCNEQERQSQANHDFLLGMSTFDDCLHTYYLLYPGDKECIRGEKGCLDDAVIVCRACSRKNEARLTNGR